ncbi:MAG TPA: adenylyl-sulfate reductase [Gammaproteobacteria bacterium]
MDNPFAPLAAFLPSGFMRSYVVLMIIAVAVGTVFDLYHKGSAKFFVQQRKRSREAATRKLTGADMAAIAVKTLAHDVATFGEFCNQQRRLSHILTFYGFVLYLITTVILVFAYPGNTPAPAILPVLWNIGILMALVGGYWFFFFLRVNVVHDGQPVWRLVPADLFIVSLLGSLSFALVYEIAALTQSLLATKVFFGFYLFFTTLLFVSVPWSKFAHMFYKPVVAFQRRVEEEDGSTDLPTPADSRTGRL